MGTEREIPKDTAAACGEAAESSSEAQATHYHSRMEVEEPARAGGSARREEAGGQPRGVRAQPTVVFIGGEYKGSYKCSCLIWVGRAGMNQ